jgi:hypothetical protein
VVRIIARMAGFDPLVTHRADSLILRQDPTPVLRAYAVVRAGRAGWPPLAVLLRLLQSGSPPAVRIAQDSQPAVDDVSGRVNTGPMRLKPPTVP